MQDNVTATECVGDSCESALVLKRNADIFSKSYGPFQFINNTVVFLLTSIINYQSLNYSVNRLCSVWRSEVLNLQTFKNVTS